MTFPDVIPADIIKTAKDIASRHSVDSAALEQEIAHALWRERQAHGLIAQRFPSFGEDSEAAREKASEDLTRGLEAFFQRGRAKPTETEGGA